MKTQINNLVKSTSAQYIDGRGISSIIVNNPKDATSGTNCTGIMAKVRNENGDNLHVSTPAGEFEMALEQSVSGKTWRYATQISASTAKSLAPCLIVSPEHIVVLSINDKGDVLVERWRQHNGSPAKHAYKYFRLSPEQINIL